MRERGDNKIVICCFSLFACNTAVEPSIGMSRTLVVRKTGMSARICVVSSFANSRIQCFGEALVNLSTLLWQLVT